MKPMTYSELLNSYNNVSNELMYTIYQFNKLEYKYENEIKDKKQRIEAAHYLEEILYDILDNDKVSCDIELDGKVTRCIDTLELFIL